MRKLFQKLVFTIALFAIVSPAMAQSAGAAGGAVSAVGGAVTLALGAVATMKKSNGEEFSADEKEMLNAVQKLVSESQNGSISKTEFETQLAEKLKQFNVSETTVQEIKNEIVEIDKLVKSVKELPGTIGKAEKQSIIKEIHDQVKQAFEDKKFANIGKGKGSVLQFTTKAPISSLISGTGNLGQTQFLPGFSEVPLDATDDILMYANVIPDNGTSARVSYMDKFNIVGNAEVVECGQPKPLRKFEIEEKTAKAIKIAVLEKVCDDYLLFIEGLDSLIENDIMQAIREKRQEVLVATIQTAANAYNLTTINTTNATNYDVLRAAIAQIRSMNYKPTHIFLNPIDAANMDLAKGTDGHYLFICTCNPQTNQITISTLRVVETNAITQGDFLIGDMSKVNIKYLTDIFIFIGKGISIDDDDNIVDELGSNITTMVGEQFINMFIKTLDGNAFLYDSFDNVKGLIS